MTDAESAYSTPRIEVVPEESLLDEQVSIRLVGFEPNELVTLHARMQGDSGRWWESRSTFRADAHGATHVSSQTPESGSYEGVDTMGFLWSMSPEPNEQADSYYTKTTVAPSVVELTAEADGRPLLQPTW